jgi:hypothetical protein
MSLPPGVQFGCTWPPSRGEICPLCRGERSLIFRRMEGANRDSSPLGDDFTLGGQLYPWGSTLPLGANFTPGGQLYPWGPTLPLGFNFTPGGQLYPWDSTLHLGANFTPEGQLYPWGPTLHLGANFTPGGQISSLGAKLKTGLRSEDCSFFAVTFSVHEVQSEDRWRHCGPNRLQEGQRGSEI